MILANLIALYILFDRKLNVVESVILLICYTINNNGFSCYLMALKGKTELGRGGRKGKILLSYGLFQKFKLVKTSTSRLLKEQCCHGAGY